jgi:NAD(P)H-dependent flavin oxidoreductase YrpB (nitropropane dioxygenase family)
MDAAVIRTPFTELIGIEHPVVSAGMGGGLTGSAGLVDAVLPAGEVVRQIAAEAEDILRSRLPARLSQDS